MKKNRFLYLIFLVIPLLLLSIHLYFTGTVDDHQNAISIDPDYAYLISAIDISRLSRSRMVLHPGTTFQMMSHAVMRCAHRWSDHFAVDFKTSVLKRPVFYLNVLQHTFSGLNILLVFLLGIFTYHISGKIVMGLLIQSTPLLSFWPIIFGFRKVTTDAVLVSVCLITVLVLVKVLHSELDRKGIYKYAAVLGLVSGFGLATKVPFLVLLVIPLVILPSLIPRLVYILTTVAGAVVFTLPILPMYSKMYKFLYGISTHMGIYGHGKEAIIDLNAYFSNLWQLVKENLPFILIVLGALVLIILVMASPEKRKGAAGSIQFKMLCAVTLAQVFGILMVTRHFKSKYLIPVLCLSGLAIYLIYIHLRWLVPPGRASGSGQKWPFRWIYPAAVIFFGLSFLFTIQGVGQYHIQRSHKLKEAIAIREKINNEFKDYCRVYYYAAPFKIFGLEFGNNWTPIYADALKKFYGDRYFYNHLKQEIYNWQSWNRVSLEKLKALFSNKIILVGHPFDRFREHIKGLPFPTKNVFGGNYFTIFKIVEK
jgi:hypothetical protein